MKGVVFDLDGTLVDSAPDIRGAANALLDDLGLERLDAAETRSFVGNGIPKLVERMMAARDITFTKARQGDLTRKFVAHYEQKPVDLSTLYPGVRTALESLKARGSALGICTNKNLGLTQMVLEGLGIAGFFDVVIAGDSLNVRKPDPAPLFAAIRALRAGGAVFIGDSEVDAATAKAAKIRFGLHAQGYRRAPVADIHHDFTFADFRDLSGHLGNL